MFKMILLQLVYFIFTWPGILLAAPVTLEFNETPLPIVLQTLARVMQRNILISPHVEGVVTLSVREAKPEPLLQALLKAHQLLAEQLDGLLYVSRRADIIASMQEQQKLHTLQQGTGPWGQVVLKLHYTDAANLRNILNQQKTLLSADAQLLIDERSNTISIADRIRVIEQVKRFVRQIDRPQPHIRIDARLAIVDEDWERELGVGVHFMGGPASSTALTLAKLANHALLDVKLSALENAGHAELISRPSLYTLNRQAAIIEAGAEVPYQESSESGGTSIAFKKAVLSLKVTPQVLPSNKVLLQLQLNQDRPSQQMVKGMPTISTHHVETTVLVNNHETVVIGGIFETNIEEGQERLPYIHQIPVLGRLLSLSRHRRSKRQLLIFITPNITSLAS